MRERENEREKERETEREREIKRERGRGRERRGDRIDTERERQKGFYVCAVECVHKHGTSCFKSYPRRRHLMYSKFLTQVDCSRLNAFKQEYKSRSLCVKFNSKSVHVH